MNKSSANTCEGLSISLTDYALEILFQKRLDIQLKEPDCVSVEELYDISKRQVTKLPVVRHYDYSWNNDVGKVLEKTKGANLW